AKKQSYRSALGLKPMKHDEYPKETQWGGVFAEWSLEHQWNCPYDGKEETETTVRTVILGLFDGVVAALTGKPVERLIPESNRDGGYDPKKIDFAAITAAMSGKSK